jgi:hypothetical protein
MTNFLLEVLDQLKVSLFPLVGLCVQPLLYNAARLSPDLKQSTCKSAPASLIVELISDSVSASKDFLDLLHRMPEPPPSIGDQGYQVESLDLYNGNGAFDDPHFMDNAAIGRSRQHTTHTIRLESHLWQTARLITPTCIT